MLLADERDGDGDGGLLGAGDCDDADPERTDVCAAACDPPGACAGDGSSSGDDPPAALPDGAAGEVDGCTCDAAGAFGPTALLLPWLLLGARRRRSRRHG